MHSYKTIQKPSEGLYKEKGSKFLAFAYPAENESEIKERITALQKKYFDARHHCYAWMLGVEKKFRAYDDGEPNHSAGDPILGQIRSKDLTNVLIVVVRYFGGVKLGVGGLVAAYKAAAEDALKNAAIVEKDVFETMTIKYPYTSTPEVMRFVKEYDAVIQEQTYGESCSLTLTFRSRDRDSVIKKAELLRAMNLIAFS
ncbi:MAG TPA: YigZ family protein [Chryseosolibacter sp.]|nr:YigZ family protein [Chryseosolibacter sp.]